MRTTKVAFSLVVLALTGFLGACAAGGSKSSDLTTGTQLRLAEATDREGNLENALSMYQAAATSAPTNISAQLHYADALARSGRVMQAQRLLTQQLKAHPGEKELARASALIDIIAGVPGNALPKLDQLIALDPRDEAARVDKGVALDLLGQHEAAQEQYRQALAIDPQDVAVSNDLALSMMLAGRQHEAQRLLEPVGEAMDAPARVKANLAILYATNGDVSRAQELAKGQIEESAMLTLAKKASAMSTYSPDHK